ncbi:MAG TPA: hypothetical protein VMU05_04185 [Dongiaceae bacterium]|nr:hypothetical protein [Dongiaceae bacterium]
MAGRRWPGLVMVLLVAAIAAGVAFVREEQATALLKLAQQSTAPIRGSLTPVGFRRFAASPTRRATRICDGPTGELKPVAGTPFDFLAPHAVGERINANDEQLKLGHDGYDHNFVIDGGGKKLVEAAEVYDPASGRVMQVWTTEPGVQFYTSNFLDGSIKGKKGIAYPRNGALCLETQHFPDSPNHPAFPTTRLNPGQKFHSETIYRFSAR